MPIQINENWFNIHEKDTADEESIFQGVELHRQLPERREGKVQDLAALEAESWPQ